MEFIRYQNIEKNEWNQHIKSLAGATFSLTAEYIEFICDFMDRCVANESFLIKLNQDYIGVAILCLEENEKGERQLSWAGRSCPAPFLSTALSYKQHEKYFKEIKKQIFNIIKTYNISKVSFSIDPLYNPDQKIKIYNYNYLLKWGFLSRSGLTQMLDLQKTEKELYSGFRKGTKSEIKKGKDLIIDFYDDTSITEELIQLYRDVYEYDAGMVTRNSELYYHYYNFIKSGKGALATAKLCGKVIAVLIVTWYNNTAYYSSYAEMTDQAEGTSPGYSLQWKLIQYLKDKGFLFYELGEQVFGPTDFECPDEKEKNISVFKRGFGGYTVPHYQGIKMIGLEQ